VRKLERFKAYARKAGFVDYWRARGWPDLWPPRRRRRFFLRLRPPVMTAIGDK